MVIQVWVLLLLLVLVRVVDMKFSFIFLSKNLLRFFIFSLLLIYLSSLVSSIGASPPMAYVDYSDDFNESFSFTLMNNNPDPNVAVELILKGPLAEFATISEKSFKFDAPTHSFTVFFNFPPYEELGLYGKQRLRIRANEIGKKNGMFTVGTAVEVWIEVYIPVPGSFAEVSSVSVNNAFEGEDTDLSFKLTNRGLEDIVASSAKVYIKDYLGNTIDTYSHSNIEIPYGESIVIDDHLSSSSYDSGKYSAVVEYKFSPDFAVSKRSATFFLGSSDIIITNYTSELVAGEINRVIVSSQSLWGSFLKDVSFDLEYSGSSHILPSRDFQPFQEVRFETFVDAPIIEDKHVDSVLLNAKMNLVIPVDADKTIEKSIPLTFNVVRPSKDFSISSTTLMVVAALVILILLFLVNFFILSKSKKK